MPLKKEYSVRTGGVPRKLNYNKSIPIRLLTSMRKRRFLYKEMVTDTTAATNVAKKRKVSPEEQGFKKNKATRNETNELDGKREKCVHVRCAATEALLGVEPLDGSGKDYCVIVADGWEHVLPQHGEDDPGNLIMWDDDNIASTVTAFNAAIAAGGVPPPPAWMNVATGGGPITVAGLKSTIMAHVQATAGGGGVVGNALIAPNDIMQYGEVRLVFGYIGIEPFFIQHATCPIGRHYVLADRRNNTTATADPIGAPPAGLGVPVFR